jgi:hypothetical protein
VEHVLPTATPLRQWVLTVPHPWRKRLADDGELLGALTRIFVSTVLGFYKARLKKEGPRMDSAARSLSCRGPPRTSRPTRTCT